MKHIFKKNQIAVTSLAILIAVAGYLNFTGTKSGVSGTGQSSDSVETMDISDGDILVKEKAQAAGFDNADEESTAQETGTGTQEDDGTVQENDGSSLNGSGADASDETGKIGEAVLTQAEVKEYVAGAKLEREQSYAKMKESLNEIIQNESAGADARKEAEDKLTKLAETIEKEEAAEQLLSSKGFENAVVSMGDDSVDVVLNYEELTQADRAQIEDIVTRKTGRDISQLIISRMQASQS